MDKKPDERKYDVMFVRVGEQELRNLVGGFGGAPIPNGGQSRPAMGDKALSSRSSSAERFKEPVEDAPDPVIECNVDRCPIDPESPAPPPTERPQVGRRSRRQR